MGEKVEKVQIRQFDGSNFSNWSYRVLRYCKTLGLRHCIEKAAEEEDFWNIPEGDAQAEAKEVLKARRMQEDDRCANVLVELVADSHLEHVKGKENPKEIWDGLRAVFERKSTTNRYLLKKQLLTMKFDEKVPLQDHFLKFDKLVRELKGAGAKLDEEDTICHLMLTMPNSYDTVTTAMSVMSDQLTMDIVRQNYLDFEAKRKGKRAEQQTEDAAFPGRSKPKFKCFSCGGVEKPVPEAERQEAGTGEEAGAQGESGI